MATGLGAWSDDEIFSYPSTGHAARHGTASGPMGEAITAQDVAELRKQTSQ